MEEEIFNLLRLENQLCFPLYACAKEVVRRYREPLAPLGLTYTQYIVLMALWERGDMTEGELGGLVRLDSGTLTPLLKRLEARGLITRRRQKTNERRLMVALTPDGLALREEAARVPLKMRGCIPLPARDLLQLRELLNRALAAMEGGEAPDTESI